MLLIAEDLTRSPNAIALCCGSCHTAELGQQKPFGHLLVTLKEPKKATFVMRDLMRMLCFIWEAVHLQELFTCMKIFLVAFFYSNAESA